MEARLASREWSRLFPAMGETQPRVLHARFVRHEYSRHTHDEFVVGLIVEGVQRCVLLKTLNYTPAGSVFCINPGEAHDGSAGAPEGYVYHTVYPTAAQVRSVAEEFGIAGLPQFTSAVIEDHALAQLLARYHESVAARASQLEQETRLRLALVLMVRRHMNVEMAKPAALSVSPAVGRARDYLAENLNEDVSLTQLAAVVDVSPFHLARAFASRYGLPPHAFRDELRVRHAARMLASDMPPADVALAVGYCDQSHLNRQFKKILGVSPGQYARAQRGPRNG